MEDKETNNKVEELENDIKDKASKILNDVKDDSDSFKNEEIESGKGMGILCYLSFLVLIPYFSQKDNSYVVYHAKQGLNLFIWEIIVGIIVGVIDSILWKLAFVTNIIEGVFSLAVAALSIIGIINVCNGKAKELPVINKMKFIK